MTILGIDPGTTSIGYAILESAPHAPTLRTAALIPIRAREPALRLMELSRELEAIIRRWKPDALAIERLFFTKNQKTAFAVAEARGVVLLTTALAGLVVHEYTPLEIKSVVTGDGRADKTQMKKMIQLTLRETKTLRARDDVFDAIAASLTCHFLEHQRAH